MKPPKVSAPDAPQLTRAQREELETKWNALPLRTMRQLLDRVTGDARHLRELAAFYRDAAPASVAHLHEAANGVENYAELLRAHVRGRACPQRARRTHPPRHRFVGALPWNGAEVGDAPVLRDAEVLGARGVRS